MPGAGQGLCALAEQHGLKARQRAPVRLNRVRSAVTQEVKVVVAAKARTHAV